MGIEPRILSFDIFEMDLKSRELRRQGRLVPLQEKPFQLLALLLKQPGEVVSREEIRQKLWESDTHVEFDDNLNHAVRKVRQALGDSPDKPGFVETLSRRGYRFLVPVRTELCSGDPIALGASDAQDPPALAVLPFLNVSSDPENEYFADGLTDELIHTLMNIGGLRVVGRTSSFQYKGKTHDLRLIGRQLGVSAVVEGSVRRDADMVLIIAQLVNTTDGFHIWSGRYERAFRDVFAIQREISEGIAETLRIRLSRPLARTLARRYTSNPEAYRLYLQAHARLGKRSRDGLLEGRKLFVRLLELQPDYAPGLAGMAMTLILSVQYELLRGADVLPGAKEAALRAIGLDPEMAEARTALAWLAGWFDWDHETAVRGFQSAITLSPGWPTSHQWLGEYLTVLGRQPEGVAEINRALELDPIAPAANAILAFALFHSRRFHEAIEQCRKTLETDSGFLMAHYFMAIAYEQLGQFDTALEELHKTQELWGPLEYRIERGVILSAAGSWHEVSSLLAEIASRGYAARDYTGLNMAIIFGRLGDFPAAFNQLDASYEERASALLYLNVDPRFDCLRCDERFGNLLKRIGLS